MKAGQGARGVRCQGRLVGLVVELVSHLEPGEPGEAVEKTEEDPPLECMEGE